MKNLFYLMASALLLWACQHSTTDTPLPDEGTATLSFDIINYEQMSLDEVTRATEATALAHLDMAIYNASSHELVNSKQTESGDDTYGKFSATLPYGDYVFVFLGYDGSRKAVLDNPESISFANDYVPNLFLKTVELNVSAETAASQSISLKRRVAAFKLSSEGTIPQTLNKMACVMNGGGHHLNALTGLASTTEERTSINTVASLAGKESMGISYYTFLPADETTMNFTVTATDQAGEVIRSRQFTNVPMKINQRTTYRGNFFAQDQYTQAFTLQLETDEWNEQEYNY